MKVVKHVVIIFLCFFGCKKQGEIPRNKADNSTEIPFPEKPNILWLVTEDMGSYIPPFGDNTVPTPNLSRLAKEGVVYPNLYSTSGVCAPSRAAIATGMYPSSIGANHMRTTSYTEVTGLPPYESVPPTDVKMISELLRKEGYYCTNNLKTDYQFKHPVTAWDESSPYAHWRNRKDGQPFYAVFNFTETHESGLFEPYGHRKVETRHYHAGDRSYKWGKGKILESEITEYVPKDTKFKIPPYLPNTEVVKRDLWKMYNNIGEMDRQVGAILQQLEEDGLLENTIIFFYGDHGGPLPREKRLIYDSGLNTPMIIRFPKKIQAGSKDNQLISFVDFAPTLLSIIGKAPKDYMQGHAFLGKFQSKNKREFIHAAADRFDGFTDAIRAVRDKKFKYIRNFKPNQGYYLPVAYREKIPTMQELLKLKAKGKLNDIQLQWFRTKKPKEELFDCENDPYELVNLAEKPEYQEKLKELRLEMDKWLKAIDDNPSMPESELITKLWSGAALQPVTAAPEVKQINGKLNISCSTKGASIGYQMVKNNQKPTNTWQVYEHPLQVPKDSKLYVMAHRIGYLKSKTITY